MKSLVTVLIMITISAPIFGKGEGIEPTRKKFEKWAKNLLIYPDAARIDQEQGVVYVSFELNVKGNAENIQVEKGISETLDQEAMKIIETMPKEHLYVNGFIEGTVFVVPVQFSVR